LTRATSKVICLTEFSEQNVLIDLGLTLIQAKTYLALIESDSLTTAEISKISKIARPDVYPNLSKLQLLGLVEKIIASPIKYEAIPINQCLSLLLRTKTEQYEKIRAETRTLLETVKTKKLKEKHKEVGNPQFVLIPQGQTVIDKINTAIENAQFSVDFVLSWKRFSRGIVTTFAESIENAWERKVITRFIVESPNKNETAIQLVQFCMKNPCCQIRFIPYYPETIFQIFDKKEMSLIVFAKTDLSSSPVLCSINHSLVSLARERFETIWKTATENMS
jgi:sugar-specific transcriptional regulator TrmB